MRWVNLLSPQKWCTTCEQQFVKQSDYYYDYKQICTSHMIRKMQEKSHVFPLSKENFINTQYTHCVETASIAKLIGCNIVDITRKTGKKTALNEVTKSHICELLSCSAMLHKVGSTPFGKFGDESVRLWFKENLDKICYKQKPLTQVLSDRMCIDFMCYSSMARSLHHVLKYNQENLTFTCSMLSTLIVPDLNDKYKDISQMGYFYAEREDILKLQESVELSGERHPLSYVLEAADKISSITAVMENSITAETLICPQLMNELRREDYFEEDIVQEEYQRFASTVKYLGICHSAVKTRYIRNIETIAMQKWIIRVQDEMAEFSAESFVRNYEEIMRGSYTLNIFDDSWCRVMRNALNYIEKKYTYNSEMMILYKSGVSKIITYILNIFINAVLYYDTDINLSSQDEMIVTMIDEKYKEVYQNQSADKDENEKLYLRLIMVLDYICDMTDEKIKGIYQKLNGII